MIKLKLTGVFALTLLVIVVFLISCNTSYLPPYFAYVEKVEPSIDGLQVNETRGGGGELEIINDTGQAVILYDESGQEYVRITGSTVNVRSGSEWTLLRNDNVFYIHDPRLRYTGPRPAGNTRQVVKEWVLDGRVGDQPFSISGQTVFEP